MDIRNLMEDKVIQIVNEICDEEERKGTAYCTSHQCRLDVACFVLNRIPQRYVTSGRGFAYLESDFNDNPQIQVDIVTLVHEGLQRVSEVQRNFYAQPEDGVVSFPVGTEAIFYFPTIKGRIFNGMNFAPITDVEILIKLDDIVVRMVDGRWPNPYSIVGNTPGTYLFWPVSLPANYEGEEREFNFSLEINDSRYEPFQHFFTIPVVAEAPHLQKTLIRDFSVSDLFLIPCTEGDNDMQLNPSDADNP